MAATLRLTNAGRAAILDKANVGLAAIRLTKLALGAGTGRGGAGDDARTTLRDQRDIAAATGAGSARPAGQIAVQAVFETATAYPATELGLFATPGAAGAEFLFAYWTDNGTVFANKPSNLRFVVAAAIAVTRSPADLDITLAPALTVGTVGAFLDLSDTPGSFVNAARRKLTVKADGTGVEFTTALAPHETATPQETRTGELTTRAVTPAGLKAVITALIGGAPADRDTLKKLSDVITALIGGAPADRDTLKKLSDVLTALIGGAPADRNTLKKLSDVIAALRPLIDARPTLVVADDRYARIGGGTFTGPVRGPHPPDDDDSTRLATTGWSRDNAGGIGSVGFFSLAAGFRVGAGAVAQERTWLTARHNVSAADRVVGLAVNYGAQAGLQSDSRVLVKRDGALLIDTGDMLDTGGWVSGLLIDKPGSVGIKAYTFAATDRQYSVLKNSNVRIFEFSAATASLVTAPIALARRAWTTIASVRVPKRRTTLRFLALASGAGVAIRLRRDAVVLFDTSSAASTYAVPGGGGTARSAWDRGLRAWVDNPVGAGNATYRLEAEGANRQIERGSYLLAD